MECCIVSTLRKPVGISYNHIRNVITYVLGEEKKVGDLTVHLIGDTKMKRLQRIYRGKNKTTDVLSFAAQEGITMAPETSLGDIFLSVPHIRQQAKDWSVSFSEEFHRMLIHGLLHILGYDHVKKTDAKIMFGKQEKYLEKVV